MCVCVCVYVCVCVCANRNSYKAETGGGVHMLNFNKRMKTTELKASLELNHSSSETTRLCSSAQNEKLISQRVTSWNLDPPKLLSIWINLTYCVGNVSIFTNVPYHVVEWVGFSLIKQIHFMVVFLMYAVSETTNKNNIVCVPYKMHGPRSFL